MPDRRFSNAGPFSSRLAGLVIVSFLTSALLAADDDFRVGDIVAAPGTRVSGHLVVAEGQDAGASIPVTVLHGRRAGPVLALIAGTHGYEYAPILALQRLRASLDPQSLSGTVIMVHIANPAAFYGRTIYRNPVDQKNLNRSYPGNPSGSYAERIAHAITEQVIRPADALIDLHGGDGNEALRPYTYLAITGDDALDRRTRGLAIAFGISHIVLDPGPAGDVAEAVFTDRTALALGKPALTTETGGLGASDEESVRLAVRGVRRTLQHLGMLNGGPPEPVEPIYLRDFQVVTSPAAGLFPATVDAGGHVAEHAVLGTLVSEFGDLVAEIRSPLAGVVNYVVATPPVSAGEPVAMVAVIVEGAAADTSRAVADQR